MKEIKSKQDFNFSIVLLLDKNKLLNVHVLTYLSLYIYIIAADPVAGIGLASTQFIYPYGTLHQINVRN